MDLGEIRVELQVRTLAQHIWAAASHKLQYKHEASVPLPLRRSIYRASALLETVDLEFDRLLQERSTYVEVQLQNESPDTLLNVEIIGAALSELLPEQYIHAEEYYDELLAELNHFGVSTKGKLKDLLISNWNAIFESDAQESANHQTMQYFSDVGLVREGLRAAFGSETVNNFQFDRENLKNNNLDI